MSILSELIGWAVPYYKETSYWFNQQFPWASNFFLMPTLLLSLGTIIIFILIYLIKPKPRHKIIPSLMFFFGQKGRSKIKSFFKKFLSDLLFLLQLIILLLLCLAAAKPFINVPETAFLGSSIIIIDGSASMQVSDRFEQAVEFAKEHLGQRNTIILASDQPKVLLEKAGKTEARGLLDSIEADDTETNLLSSTLIAKHYLEKGSNIFIISDFLEPQLDELKTAANILESQAAKVFFYPVGSSASNIGIVDLEVSEKKSEMLIRNYNNHEEIVRIKVNNELIDTKTIGALSSEIFSFNTPHGKTKVGIDVNDDFKVDNQIYISTPQESSNSVLVITNDEEFQNTLFHALLTTISENSTTELEIHTANPPKVPDIWHDLIIMKDVDPKRILPGTIDSIESRVKEGGSLIIMVQEGLFQIDFKGLNPVELIEEKDRVYVNKVASSLTKDLDFGTATPFYKVNAKEGVSPIAVADNPELSPVIAYGKYDNGLVAYYGIVDETSDFVFEPRYPVFWKNFINLLLKKPSLESLNQKTGSTISFTKSLTIKTPTGSERASSITLNRGGMYETSEKNVAANLLSESESDVSVEEADFEEIGKSFKTTEDEKPLDLTKYFVIVALVMLFIELIYVKYRGDF